MVREDRGRIEMSDGEWDGQRGRIEMEGNHMRHDRSP